MIFSQHRKLPWCLPICGLLGQRGENGGLLLHPLLLTELLLDPTTVSTEVPASLQLEHSMDVRARNRSEQERFPPAWLRVQARRQETLSIKGQMVNVSSFARHTVSVTTTQFCCHGTKHSQRPYVNPLSVGKICDYDEISLP